MCSDRDTHRMTVWPEHTSLSRRKNTIGSSCKADRYFSRSAVEAASNRPGWSELTGEENIVFHNTMRSYETATHLPWFGTGVLVSPPRVCFNERDAWRAVAETGTGETDCCCLLSEFLLLGSWGGCSAVTGLHCACVCQITTTQVLLGTEYNFLDLIIHGFAGVMRLIFSVQIWQIVVLVMRPQTEQFKATDHVGLY